MSDLKPVVVKLELPFAVERRGRPEREQVVGWDRARSGAYLAALQRELSANAGQFDDCEVVAVRMGGGIATNAAGEDLAALGTQLRRSLHVAEDAFTSARASLANISGASITYLRRAGVRRFDFELLSLDKVDFGRLNHVDALQDLQVITEVILHGEVSRSYGVVLAYGYETTGTAPVRRSALEAARSCCSHVTFERWQGWRAGGVAAASDEQANAQLEQARDALAANGFMEYAPLRFARAGEADPYWSALQAGTDVLGFGLGARTAFDGAVSVNTTDWDTYLRHSDDFSLITASSGPRKEAPNTAPGR